MAGQNSPQKRTTTSGISVNKESNIDDYNVTGTVTLSRRSMGLAQPTTEPAPKKTAPPPPSQVAKMPYSVATAKNVACPRCQDKYDITKEYYNTVTQCLGCGGYFVIRPPGTPPYKPTSPAQTAKPGIPSAAQKPSVPPGQKSTTSGIQVQPGNQGMAVTGTVLLSRSGMSMMQRRRGEKRRAPQQSRAAAPPPPPPPAAVAGMIYSVATDRDIGCPKCNERFEISPEFYNAVAECPDCSCEFVIKPPGTPPYTSPATAPKPTVPSPAAPSRPSPSPAMGVSVAPPPAAVSQPSIPAPSASPPAPAASSSGKKSMDPLVIGLFVAVVILLIAIIVILLVLK